MAITSRDELARLVRTAVTQVEVTDVHTHLYPPSFGNLLLWGIDDLITYHYLVAEVFRFADVSYDAFWRMSKRDQADLIWRHLFQDNSPYGEACRGVLTTLQSLGLDVQSRDLASYRRYFDGTTVEEYVDTVFEAARINRVVMTNDPFDPAERRCWLGGFQPDPRFRAALRLDQLLNSWDQAWPRLQEWGYGVGEDLTGATLDQVRRFLAEWADRMQPVYLAASLPPTFAFPEDSARGALIRECVLPLCEQLNRPFAMMIGVEKRVNPALRDAGDAVGKADIHAVERLCADHPKNKFLVTMLARENQHELCVAARKFRNLLIFGCWWFLNNPSLVEEITRMRCELLGLGFLPQHSDARVLDQLIYKWRHSRKIIGDVLCDKYADLAAAGWAPTEPEIRRDVANLFGGNFWSFVERNM